MTCDDLRGIVNLDAEVVVKKGSTKEDPTVVSLRQVLLFKFKLSDGTSLVAEVHQRGTMGLVDVIVPNIPEAEAMLLMMNRHFPAFCVHYLTEKGMDKKLVMELVREVCCPTLVGSIKECQWDSATRTITTAAQIEEDARMQEMEKAAWYWDEFGKNMLEKVKRRSHTRTRRRCMPWMGNVRSKHYTPETILNRAHQKKGKEMTSWLTLR